MIKLQIRRKYTNNLQKTNEKGQGTFMRAMEEERAVAQYFGDAFVELKTMNRFHNEKLDKVVDVISRESSNNLVLENRIFKRARLYEEPDAVERFLNPPTGLYQGYNAQDSGANPNGTEGRCNPEFISYLYVANSVHTAIAEIGAGVEQVVSVADVQVIQELKILHLAKRFSISSTKGTIIKDVEDNMFTSRLQQLFSKPYKTDGDYLLTQYLSEKIKMKGYDGVSFNSSKYVEEDKNGLPRHGINYVIFIPEKCKVISSKLYKVDSIDIRISSRV